MLGAEAGAERSVQIDLTGRVALVTGSGRNIGRAIALTMARAGAAVAIHGRTDRQRAEAVCQEAQSLGAPACVCMGDLSAAPEAQRIAAEAQEQLGTVDILVNCAAVRPHRPFLEITPEEFGQVVETNLRGPFFLSQAVLPGMVERGWGRIINISGMDAYWGIPNRAHVVSTKAGLLGFTRALANEFGTSGVTVNAVLPGVIETQRDHQEWYPDVARRWQSRLDRIPMGRLGQPDEVAGVCLFLASDLASYMTGQALLVSGGGSPLVRFPEG